MRSASRPVPCFWSLLEPVIQQLALTCSCLCLYSLCLICLRAEVAVRVRQIAAAQCLSGQPALSCSAASIWWCFFLFLKCILPSYTSADFLLCAIVLHNNVTAGILMQCFSPSSLQELADVAMNTDPACVQLFCNMKGFGQVWCGMRLVWGLVWASSCSLFWLIDKTNNSLFAWMLLKDELAQACLACPVPCVIMEAALELQLSSNQTVVCYEPLVS